MNHRTRRIDAIRFVTVAWKASDNVPPPGASNVGVMPGDMLYLCGYDWNYSGQSRGGKDLRCGWLDADNTAGNSPHHISINAGVMGQAGIGHQSKSTNLCGLGVAFAVGGRRMRSIEDKVAAHRKAFGTYARVHKSLSAIELCDSPTSWGSSFFSIEEGVFCDMSTKTKYNICDKNSTTPCFSHERSLKRDGTSKIIIKNPGAGAGATARGMDKPIDFFAEYFTITDLNGTVIDNGQDVFY